MKEFFGELDSPGGHIAVCIGLILLGAALSKFSVPKAEDLIIFALGTMGRSMLGKNGKGTVGQ
jgi:hypothetical protein